jgi:hypothetical protein
MSRNQELVSYPSVQVPLTASESSDSTLNISKTWPRGEWTGDLRQEGLMSRGCLPGGQKARGGSTMRYLVTICALRSWGAQLRVMDIWWGWEKPRPREEAMISPSPETRLLLLSPRTMNIHRWMNV